MLRSRKDMKEISKGEGVNYLFPNVSQVSSSSLLLLVVNTGIGKLLNMHCFCMNFTTQMKI